MPITNVPTFVDGEILTASKLNQIGTAITTKFSGAVTGADLAWPLVAQGNIDLNNAYGLLNLRTLWGVINAAEYDTLSDAVSALPSAGGAIFVPPNTTITADGVSITKPVMIFGAGKTSVLKLTTGSTSGYLLRVTGTNDVDIVNLTVDGNSATGSSQDGIQLRQIDGARVLNVWFKNFSGVPLVVGNDGTGGNSSLSVVVAHCKFEGGSDDHLLVNDVDGLSVMGCEFSDPTNDCIQMVPTNSSSIIRSALISGNKFSNCARAVYAVGESASPSNQYRLIRLIGNEALTTSGVAYTLGAASVELREIMCLGNIAIGAGGDAFVIRAERGMVQGNYAPSATGDGLDMTESVDLVVAGNSFPDAGAIGIDATSTADCRVMYNDVHNATTEGVTKDSATGLDVHSNLGDFGTDVNTAYGADPDETAAAAASGTFTANFTIPANTLKVGDLIRIRAHVSHSGTADLTTFNIDFGGGQNSGSVTVNSNNDAAGEWLAVVDALSGAGSTKVSLMGINSNAGVYTTNSSLAVDWTSDVQLDVDWTKAEAGNTLVLNILTIEVIGGTA